MVLESGLILASWNELGSVPFLLFGRVYEGLVLVLLETFGIIYQRSHPPVPGPFFVGS